ncbi:hypothetical protein FEE96_15630 [Parasedimentitalea maritima]|uniref:Calcium-binding protein n=1 Tax=Parasedimentitalea maritima TaxID=2578117 RepID=A0ABY2UXC3_9RHOB|nr:hypothetical protein [Zongyanglinia marina]TLP60291.1 hypothetical protein FEE96_15630 [Zongyanglinia marina]
MGNSIPTALEVIEAHGATSFDVRAAGSGLLSVMRRDQTGALVATDHLLDTLGTRFDDVQALASLSADGWSFLIAGGSDDWMSLFILTPDDRLVHLDAIVHQLGTGLENVEAISAIAVGDEIQFFVTSATASGVSQFTVPLENLGAIITGNGALVGTADGDLLQTGAGTTALTGGAGRTLLWQAITITPCRYWITTPKRTAWICPSCLRSTPFPAKGDRGGGRDRPRLRGLERRDILS